MTDVFISYSRKDKEFVQVLHQALVNSRYETWVDWQDIPLTADWWAEIQAGIEAADTFVFVISPDSVVSKVCRQEIDHAAENNKRIVPIVRREGFDTAEVHPVLGKHNWLFFREQDDFDSVFAALVNALNTDLAYVKAHTRLLIRALEWEKKQRRDDLLLRGQDLLEAEQWLENALMANYGLLPTEQQKTYIHKSRDAEAANQRLAAAGEKAKRLVRVGAGILAGTIAVASVIGWVTQRSAMRTRKLAQIEQQGINALRQFEFQELEALLQAMNAAEDLRQVMGSGDQPLSHYTANSAPLVLQQILDRIRQKNQFAESPDILADDAVISAFSPQGDAISVTSGDGTVTLRTPQGAELSSLYGHFGKVWRAEFSPDGQTIATESEDLTFRLWRRDGTFIKALEHPSKQAGRIRFSPDGQYLVTAGWGKDTILLLDAAGNSVGSIPAKTVTDVAFHPDSKQLASASDAGVIEIWNLQGKKLNTLRGHEGPVRRVQFSPDGNYLASGATDQTVRLWNLKTGQSTVIPNLQGWVLALDFHPQSRQIAASSSGGIARVWDLEGNIIWNLPGHVGTANSTDFSPDGKRLMTTADDGQVRVWSLAGREAASLEGHTEGIWNADVSPDGTRVATAGVDGATRIWDLSGKEIGRLKLPYQYFFNVVYSPDGNTIATSTDQGKIQLWTAKGSLTSSFEAHSIRILGLDFSPDGKYVVSGSDDNTAKLWDLEGNVLTTVTHDSWIRSVAFSPDGKSFATASEDDLARLWDLQGNLLAEFKGHADGVDSVSFSPDGTQIVTASDDGTVKLWNVKGNLLYSLQKHHGKVWTVEFSPDGDAIATGTSDGYARLWDLQGNLIGEFKGHDVAVSSVNFSADGRSLVTTAVDGTAKVWEVAQTLDDLLHYGCEWLEEYLAIHPEALTELETCQSQEMLQTAAPQLVTQADSMAKKGDAKGAIATYRTAKIWDSTLEFEPETRTRQFVAIGKAEALAEAGEVDAALAAYQAALELDPKVGLNPEQAVKRIAVNAAIKRGMALGEAGDAAGAEAAFQEALALDPNLSLEPALKAQELAAYALVEQALEHLSANEGEEAAAKFRQTQSLEVVVDAPEEEWRTLCFQLALSGFAAEALPACDRAVEVDSAPGRWESRRGVARALAGDKAGAIADFQTHLAWAKTTTLVPTGSLDDRIQRMQSWVAALQAGKNPFTPEEIEKLKKGGL